MLTEYEKGFLEGAIDADGCITITKVSQKRVKWGWTPQISLQVDNNNYLYLQKIKNIIGEGTITHRHEKTWSYRLYKYGCKRLFPQIKLIVKEKRRQHSLKIFQTMENQFNPQPNYEETLTHLMTTIPPASQVIGKPNVPMD